MSNNDSKNKRIAKNSIYLTIRMIIVLGISLYTTRAILSVLGVMDYGIYNVIAGFVTMFAFLNTSMSATSQRFFNVEYAKNGIKGAKVAFNASLRIHLILALIIVCITELFGIWYLTNKINLPENRIFAAQCVFHSSVVSLFFTILNVPFLSAILAHEKMDFYAVVTVVDAFLKLFIVLILPYSSCDYLISYGILYILISVFDFTAYCFYAKTKFDEIKIESVSDTNIYKAMMAFTSWNTIGFFSFMLRNQGITLVLNAYFGPIVNAARGVAVQVDSAINGFVNNMVVPARPQITQSYAQNDIDRAFFITYSISKLSCLFFFLFSLPLILESKIIFSFWLGNNIPEHTTSFIAIILVTNMFGCLLPPISTLVFAEGKMKFFQLLTSASNLLSIPLALLFLLIDPIPEYVFIALFITMVTNQIAAMIALKKCINYSVKKYLRQVLFPVLKVVSIVTILALPVHFIMDESILRFFIQVLTCLLTTILVTYFFALESEEQCVVCNYVKRILSKLK